MSEKDLSKVIGLIMENPQLIEQIKGLIDKEDGETPAPVSQKEDTPEANAVADISELQGEPSIQNAGGEQKKLSRNELLYALKPYLSPKRKDAIESMARVADIVDMMRAK